MGVDELYTDSAKDVPIFLWGAPDTDAKARKHLRRDIGRKMEEGVPQISCGVWHGRPSAYQTPFWLAQDSVVTLENG